MRSLHKSTFAIGLFGDRMEVALWRRGGVVASRRRPIALDDKTDTEHWIAAVRELGPALREMVGQIMGETNTRVRRAFVLHASPTAVGDCMSVPVRTATQACSAASLAVMDSMQCAIETVVAGTLFIERDAAPPSSGRSMLSNTTASKTDGRAQRAHVVAAAECEGALTAIQAMVEEAGLRFQGAVPVQAAIAACALSRAGDREATLVTANPGPSGGAPLEAPAALAPTAHLHVAESGSFLLIRECQTASHSNGILRFTRSIPIGTSALAASLTRRGRKELEDSQVGDAEPNEPNDLQPDRQLDHDAALRALHEFGLPATPDAIHEPTGLTARDVLPLLQPLVQRLTVELRQSLRFALDVADRGRVTFVLSGPGAAVPGLAAALGRELNVPAFAQRDGGDDSNVPLRPASAKTDLGEAINAYLERASNSISDLALMPPELALRISAMRIRRGLWAGAAAALLLIVLDAGRLASHLAHARHDLQTTTAAIRPANVADQSPILARVEEDPAEVLALIEAARRFRMTVDRETSRQVDFRGCMHELSRITPASVRFTNVTFQSPAAGREATGRIGATIVGLARPSGDTPARSELERFVLELRASPLFDDVSLTNVHVDSDDSPDQRFEVRFVALPAPVHARRLPLESDHPGAAVPAIAAASSPVQGGEE